MAKVDGHQFGDAGFVLDDQNPSHELIACALLPTWRCLFVAEVS
jgi:hypothetical protein